MLYPFQFRIGDAVTVLEKGKYEGQFGSVFALELSAKRTTVLVRIPNHDGHTLARFSESNVSARSSSGA